MVKTRSLWCAVPVAVIAVLVALFVRDATNTSIEGLQLQGKRVVVCGASMGIGKDVARQYALAGAHVVMAARSMDKLQDIKDELVAKDGVSGDRVHAAAVDLGDEEACKALIHQSAALLGGLDVLVLNHVAYAHYGDWTPVPDKARVIEMMFRVNTFSYIWLASEALSYLQQAQGSVVVVSSLAGKVGLPRSPIYSGTKHALHGFFDSLRHEFALNKVPVSLTSVVLGSIDTDSVAHMKTLIQGVTWAPPEQAARAIIRAGALRRREVAYPFAQVWAPATFLRILCPEMLDRIMRSTMAANQA